MHIDVQVENLIPVYTENTIYEVLLSGKKPLRILGGGSNILFTQNVDGVLLKNEIKGIDIIDEDNEAVLVRVGGGENWHQFVMWSLSHNLSGIENLALIPGTVGAAPIQNIGAYGVEQQDNFHSLEAIDLENGIKSTYYKGDCDFGYRNSIFKNDLKGQVLITHVTYQLSKKANINIQYGAIQSTLEEKNITDPSILDVANAVITIRQSKLPDPKELGNTGSFFKNPIIPMEQFDSLKSNFENIVSYPVSDTHIKVPAAWLIDQCELKGYRKGDAGIHKNHALILVNYGNAKGSEMLELAEMVMDEVRTKFGIELEPEVNIW